MPPPVKVGVRLVLNWNLSSKNNLKILFCWETSLTSMSLGDNASALALAERAIAMMPIEKDTLTGPRPLEILARVAARIGDPERNISTLEKLLSIPYEAPLAANPPLTPALLRLDPMFESLRKDPRFQKLANAQP